MTTCATPQCNNAPAANYAYCTACYARWKATKAPAVPAPKPPGAWHADPVVDALLKINANLKTISTELTSIRLELTTAKEHYG